jgi:D-xylose transport system substrate-binding protein
MKTPAIKWALSLILILAGSSGFTWLKLTPNHGGKPVLVGFAIATLQEERWRRDRDFFQERLRQLGAKLIVTNATNDAQRQIRQVRFLIGKKIDVLVIVPHDLNQAAVAVELAKRAGIKVVTYDRLIRNARLDLYISFDNIKVGELMAEYLVNQAPTGNYVIINGAPTDNNCYLFNQGYKHILQPYVREGKIKIAYETWAEDWCPGAAYQYLQKLLAAGKKFNAVIAANDSLASAAIEALAEWRLAGKIPVVGHDADLSACQRIVEGTQLMTVYKPLRKLAYRAADLAFGLAADKKIKTNAVRTFNGKYRIPSEIISPVAIDKSSMDLVIKDGFHSRKEIYLNLPK